MSIPVTLLWLRNDLRLIDHPALLWAAARGRIVPVYIRDPTDPWKRGGASQWALHQILSDLIARLAQVGAPLVLRTGDPFGVLQVLAAETGATALAFSRAYDPHGRAQEKKMESLAGPNFAVRCFSSSLLFEPETIRTKSGGPFRVYTPFAKACFAAPSPVLPLAGPRKVQGVEAVSSDKLADWALEPQGPDWAAGLRSFSRLTEEAARATLLRFVDERMAAYRDARDSPDRAGTSELSPFLAFGVLSPRQVWAAALLAMEQNPAARAGGEVFLKELLWREFAYHLLFETPSLPEKPLQKAFAALPWRKDKEALRAWQRGQTGYPIVDAGMRQLWQTGWMHNRVRMIVASFLVKDLLLPWQEGEAWFWDTLADADLANNAASWQWVAGCGADAAPFFRIFNPVLQGKKFDPDGAYVRTYVPELKGIKGGALHAPWLLSAESLAESGVILGKNYPKPLVDHAFARDRALSAFRESKKS